MYDTLKKLMLFLLIIPIILLSALSNAANNSTLEGPQLQAVAGVINYYLLQNPSPKLIFKSSFDFDVAVTRDPINKPILEGIDHTSGYK